MPNTPGLFLALEGVPGLGKTTQCRLLIERLRAEGYEIKYLQVTELETGSAYFVRNYLQGKYGDKNTLEPYTASLFYALQRFDAAPQISEWLSQGYIVLADTFINSSKVNHGQKIEDTATRLAYYQWLDQLEFGMLGIPQPDTTIVLTVPAETAIELAKKQVASQHIDSPDDDPEHIQRTVATYRELYEIYQETFAHIDCAQHGELMSIPTINNLIWERISPMLKKIRKHKVTEQQASATEVFAPKKTENPYITKNEDGSFTITDTGKIFLQSAVTDTKGEVYAFTHALSDATIAAAMARLSSRGDDMRVTILDEFTVQNGQETDLLQKVITANDDGSVRQLNGIHMVVEGASTLLAKKLEWGRLASYLEQSTRHIFFDQKDEQGQFKYHTPATFDEKTAAHYNTQMDNLFKTYTTLVRKLTNHIRSTSRQPHETSDGAWKGATRAQACDAVRAVLPLATKSTVGIFASGQALESLILHLQSDELAESHTVGKQLLKEAKKVAPAFLERADKPKQGGALIAYHARTRKNLEQLAQKMKLQPIKGNGDDAMRLTDFWPKNELDVLPHMLYKHSSLSLDELKNEIAGWPYIEKEAAFKTYFGERLNRRHKPGRALETIHYSFDLMCDYGIFHDLQRHRMVDALQWQALTPHYGYEIPDLVTEAGLDDLFEQCFDTSVQLYHYLLASDYVTEAQYVTLIGHKMRWKVTMNAREAYHFMELHTSPQGNPGYRKLVQHMYEAIAEVHPLVASGMIFVDKDEAKLTQ